MAPLNQERHDAEHDRMEIEGNYRSQPAAYDLYSLEHDPRPTRNHRFPICRPSPLVLRLNGSSAAGNAVENVIRHAPRCVLVESWPPVTFRRDVMATQRRGRISVSWFAALGFFIVEHCYVPGKYTYSLLLGCLANWWEVLWLI